ncbi:MAG: dihydrodipicolinate synthase family protein [Pirellulaceae bacterium]
MTSLPHPNERPDFTGNIPPILTPLADYDRLDEGGYERLLEHLIRGGMDGIFLLGSSSETVSLSHRLRVELIQKGCRHIAHRVPVLVGITDNSVVETVQLAHEAAEAGADGLVLTTPFYFPVSQAELKVYVRAVLKETNLPLMLYNMPAMTKLWYAFETVAELAQHEQIVGIKDSSQNMKYFRQLTTLRSVRPDWSFLIGAEAHLAESLRHGGSGGVNMGPHLFPRLFTELLKAHRAGDTQRVDEYQIKIDQIAEVYRVAEGPVSLLSLISTTKTALSILGICNDLMASPHLTSSPAQRGQIESIVTRLKSELG